MDGTMHPFLQEEGLIKLDKKKGFKSTVLDIVENPKNLKIKELAAEQLPRALDDADIGVINGNYAIECEQQYRVECELQMQLKFIQMLSL